MKRADKFLREEGHAIEVDHSFDKLWDTPITYSGLGGNYIRIGEDEIALEYVSASVMCSGIDHSMLTNLDYDSAGHLDFLSISTDQIISGTKTFISPLYFTNTVSGTGDIYCGSLYVEGNSIYVNKKKVISDPFGTVTISTDDDEDLIVRTVGLGSIELKSEGYGVIRLLSDDEVNSIAKGGMEWTVPANNPTKHINFTNQSIGGNITFTAQGINSEVQFVADDEIELTAPSININGDVEVVGIVTGSAYYGDGSNLTGIATQFTELTDTPITYSGYGNRYVTVRADEFGLEYVDKSTVVSGLDHSVLNNLEYEFSGHEGFVSTGTDQTIFSTKTFDGHHDVAFISESSYRSKLKFIRANDNLLVEMYNVPWGLVGNMGTFIKDYTGEIHLDTNGGSGEIFLNGAVTFPSNKVLGFGKSGSFGPLFKMFYQSLDKSVHFDPAIAGFMGNKPDFIVFNEAGYDTDIRMEGDTDPNLFFLDAGNNRIGIGTNTPLDKLDIDGNIVPHVNSTYNLGSSTAEWNRLYVETIYGPISDTFSVVADENMSLVIGVGEDLSIRSGGSDIWSCTAGGLVTNYNNLIPSNDLVYDLGSPSNRWRSLYVGNLVSTTTISGDILPSIDDTYDLGSSIYNWKYLHVETIHGNPNDNLYISTSNNRQIRLYSDRDIINMLGDRDGVNYWHIENDVDGVQVRIYSDGKSIFGAENTVGTEQFRFIGDMRLEGDLDYLTNTISGTGDIYCGDLYTSGSSIHIGNTIITSSGVEAAIHIDGSIHADKFCGDGSDLFNVHKIIQCYNIDTDNVNVTTPIAISWGGEDFKDDEVYEHSIVTNNSRLYMKKKGIYEIAYTINIDNTTNKRRTIRSRIRKNGDTYLSRGVSYSYSRNTTDDKQTNSGGPVLLLVEKDDYIEIMCDRQGSNGVANEILDECFINIKLIHRGVGKYK